MIKDEGGRRKAEGGMILVPPSSFSLPPSAPPDPELIEAATVVALLGARTCRARKRAAGERDAEGEANTYGLPEGAPIAAELRDWLAKQRAAVLEAIPAQALPETFPDLTAEQWVDPMAKAMVPILGGYWDHSGKEVYSRLGLDPEDWRVVNPHLNAQIQKQAFAFCEATNATTTKRLHQSLESIRQQFVIGMVEEGESVRELTNRVKYVFEGLSTSHARSIAATEASRAVHAAELTADVESDVVAGLELLLSGDACPLCRKIAAECKRVRLGQPFATIGSNPHYKDVRHPPLHPHCQCTMIEVLKPEYGGPVAPEWGHTLDQPQKQLKGGYTPPPGKPEPKPEPDRPKPVPTKPPPAAKTAPEQPAIDQAVAYASPGAWRSTGTRASTSRRFGRRKPSISRRHTRRGRRRSRSTIAAPTGRTRRSGCSRRPRKTRPGFRPASPTTSSSMRLDTRSITSTPATRCTRRSGK